MFTINGKKKNIMNPNFKPNISLELNKLNGEFYKLTYS